MPVLQLFCAHAADIDERLRSASLVVSEALDLPPDGVVATHVHVQSTWQQGHAAPDWPVVVIHGSTRSSVSRKSAVVALAELARSWVDGEP